MTNSNVPSGNLPCFSPRALWRAAAIPVVIPMLALTGCGSGGGSGGGINSTPPPASTPPPTPAQLGLTQQSSFTTTALVYRHGVGSGPDRTSDVEFKYSAADKAYEMRVPDVLGGRLSDVHGSGTPSAYWFTSFKTTDSSGGSRTVYVDLYKPGAQNPELALSYTSMGSWRVEGPTTPLNSGFFAYGVPTPANEVPVTGTGTYAGQILGSGAGGGLVTGDMRMEFDFFAGTLAGEMRPTLRDPTGLGFNDAALGIYRFTNTVFEPGSTNFSGSFIAPGATGSSWFEGSFNGPGAAEVMARWQAPFVHPDGFSGTIFGVSAAKRQ